MPIRSLSVRHVVVGVCVQGMKRRPHKQYQSMCSESLRPQEENQQQLQKGEARMQPLWRRRMSSPRSMWVRKWLSEDRRQQLGHYSTFLSRTLRNKNVNAFLDYMVMPSELFDAIWERVIPVIKRQDTKFRPASPPRHMVPEVCKAIVEIYKDEVFAVYVTPDQWRARPCPRV